jgi:hypothetical protein
MSPPPRNSMSGTLGEGCSLLVDDVVVVVVVEVR